MQKLLWPSIFFFFGLLIGFEGSDTAKSWGRILNTGSVANHCDDRVDLTAMTIELGSQPMVLGYELGPCDLGQRKPLDIVVDDCDMGFASLSYDDMDARPVQVTGCMSVSNWTAAKG